jgi:hypothetical protein
LQLSLQLSIHLVYSFFTAGQLLLPVFQSHFQFTVVSLALNSKRFPSILFTQTPKAFQPSKMRQSFFSALFLGFSAVARATISSPAAGYQWPVDQNQNINWDTTGLTAPLDIHLVPAGAVDLTVVIVDIALKVGNTGTFQWAPPETITIEEVEIIIVDATKKLVISETFVIVIIEVSFHLIPPTLKLSDVRNRLRIPSY